MTKKSVAPPAEAPKPLPHRGGRYRREADGALTRLSGTAADAPPAAQAAMPDEES